MRVGVDGEQAPGREGEIDQTRRRVASFRPAVDLDGGVVIAARGEDRVGIERRFGPASTATGDEPSGAVPEYVDVWVRHRTDHPSRHRRSIGPQVGVHTRDHDIDFGEQALVLIERTVVEDVDLDPGENPCALGSLVERRDDVELGTQPLRAQSVRDLQPRGVVGEREVFVSDHRRCDSLHLVDGTATVGPVRMGVQVAAQRLEQIPRTATDRFGLLTQLHEIGGFPVERLADDGRGLLTDAGQVGPRVRPAQHLAPGVAHLGEHLGRTSIGLHPIGVGMLAFEPEGDFAQCVDRVHPSIVATGPP